MLTVVNKQCSHCSPVNKYWRQVRSRLLRQVRSRLLTDEPSSSAGSNLPYTRTNANLGSWLQAALQVLGTRAHEHHGTQSSNHGTQSSSFGHKTRRYGDSTQRNHHGKQQCRTATDSQRTQCLSKCRERSQRPGRSSTTR